MKTNSIFFVIFSLLVLNLQALERSPGVGLEEGKLNFFDWVKAGDTEQVKWHLERGNVNTNCRCYMEEIGEGYPLFIVQRWPDHAIVLAEVLLKLLNCF